MTSRPLGDVLAQSPYRSPPSSSTASVPYVSDPCRVDWPKVIPESPERRVVSKCWPTTHPRPESVRLAHHHPRPKHYTRIYVLRSKRYSGTPCRSISPFYTSCIWQTPGDMTPIVHRALEPTSDDSIGEKRMQLTVGALSNTATRLVLPTRIPHDDTRPVLDLRW